MAIIEKVVKKCTICGKSSCSGKEFKVHLKYDYYKKVDKWITVCESEVYKATDREIGRKYSSALDYLKTLVSRVELLENKLKIPIEKIEDEKRLYLQKLHNTGWMIPDGVSIPKKYYYKVVHGMGASDEFEAIPND